MPNAINVKNDFLECFLLQEDLGVVIHYIVRFRK